MSVIWWTDEDNELLKKLYPKTIDKNDIIKALKNKTWYAIQKQAKELGLKREVKNTGGRPKKKPKQFLGKNQLMILLKKDLTIEEIAKKLRSEPHIVRRFIQKYGL
jgi:transposase